MNNEGPRTSPVRPDRTGDSRLATRGLWVLAGVVAVVLLGLTIALVWRGRSGGPATVAVAPGTPGPAGARAVCTDCATAPAIPLRRLAFASDRDPQGGLERGNWEIYVMREDGSEQTRLTNDPLHDLDPIWSPDGRRIAFLRIEGMVEQNVGELSNTLMVMPAPVAQAQVDAAGGVPTPLFETRGSINTLAWSPDGSKFLLTTIRQRPRFEGQLVVMDAETGEVVTLVEKPTLGAQWSPDGSRIAYTTFDAGVPYVHVMRPDGSEDTRTTTFISGFPAWAPDGQRLAFIVWTGQTSSYVALQQDLSQRQVDYLTPDTLTSQWKFDLQWAPDGERLLFVAGYEQDGSDGDLYLLSLDGDDPVNLTEQFGPAVTSPEWSPDGRRIVFTSLEGEPSGDPMEMIGQVYLLDVATKQIKQLTTEGRNGLAVWEPGPRD